MSARDRRHGVSGPAWRDSRRTTDSDDPFGVFLRGLVVGAFVGAIVAGSAALRRLMRR